MALFYITLQSGRTDNIYLEADNKQDIINFITAISNCHISCIKKVVYSKKHLIGTSTGALAHKTVLGKNLRVMCASKNHTSILDFRFAKKDLEISYISTQIKKYLLLNNEPINRIINAVKGI